MSETDNPGKAINKYGKMKNKATKPATELKTCFFLQ